MGGLIHQSGPSRKTYKAHTIGREASLIIERSESGVVHSVYDQTINLVFGGELVTILLFPQKDWYGINLVGDSGPIPDVHIGARVEISQDKLLLVFRDSQFSIDLGDAVEYQPTLEGLRLSLVDLKPKVEAIRSLVSKSSVPDSSLLALFFKPLEGETKAAKGTAFGSMAYGRIQDLLRGLAQNDWEMVDRSARGLVGFGYGLTPSGDDFLSGLSAALWMAQTCFHQLRTEFDIVRQSIIAHCAQTHFISRKLLLRALDGRFSDPVNQFLEDFFWQGRNPKDSLHRLLRVGSTSGGDILLGLYCGIKILLRKS